MSGPSGTTAETGGPMALAYDVGTYRSLQGRGGLTYSSGAVDLSVSAQTTVARTDLAMQSYRGSLTVHF